MIVAPDVDGTTLHALQVSVEPKAIPKMADGLREAAEWVGCDSVALGRVDPPAAAAPLRAALDG